MRHQPITSSVRQRPAAPGLEFARLARCKALARLDGRSPLDVARQEYGADARVTGAIKAAIAAGSTTAGNWAADIVSAEGGIVADFLAYLRPATILGRFGQGSVPALRALPFRIPTLLQTGGGQGYWVGEGRAKPLTSFDFERSTLEPLKVANIAVLTEESIRDSSPSSEMIVRDALRDALAARLDIDFVDPAKAASAGVSPASITNGAASIASTGFDGDAIRLLVRGLFAKFIAASNPLTSGVWIMSAMNALSLSMMTNPLGQAEFAGIAMNGGVFQGLPVIVSEHIGDVVVLLNAGDIFLGDEGGVQVDMTREATLEFSDTPTQDAIAGTGVSMISLWQTNSVGLRAERVINWQRRRASSVAYATGVAWGGAVPNS